MIDLLNRPIPMHEELRAAILEGVEIMCPASDRLVAMTIDDETYTPLLLEMTEAFEALERALALLAEERQRYQ